MLTIESNNNVLSSRRLSSLRLGLIVYAILLALVLLAFGSALNGDFLADEVWYLPIVWRGCHGEPGLIWGQFLAPYTYHESLYVMYRPLVVISYVVDYFFWRLNPLGFHLTNILLHWANACLVFIAGRLLLQYLLLNDDKEGTLDRGIDWKIPLMVSAAFAVYPGQTEPACWIMPRIDTLASAFYFASLIGMLKYWLNSEKRWFHASCVFMVLGLLTKEMCVTIPFVLIAIQLLHLSGVPAPAVESKRTQLNQFRAHLLTSIRDVQPMLILLPVYFIVRMIALDTPIGGYVGSLGLYLDSTYLERLFNFNFYWLFLHPINLQILGRNSLPDILLRVIYVVIAVLLVVNYRVAPCMRLRLALTGWLFGLGLIMFLPGLQIWFVSGGLMGTRLAYSVCFLVFLAIVLLLHPVVADRTFDIAIQKRVKLLRLVSYVVVAAFVAISIYISRLYAEAWTETSKSAAAMRLGITESVSKLPPEKKAVVLNLPADSQGGIVTFFTIDFLPDQLRPGLTASDLSSRVICIDGAPINMGLMNFARLKGLIKDSDKYEFLLWRPAGYFNKVHFPHDEEIRAPQEQTLSPRFLGRFDEVDGFDKNKSQHFFSNNKPGTYMESFMLPLSRPINPFDAELLELRISCRPQKGFKYEAEQLLRPMPWQSRHWLLVRREGGPKEMYTPCSGLISWNSQLNTFGKEAAPIAFNLFETHEPLLYRIDLTQYKRWLIAGSVSAFRLDLPIEDHSYNVESAVLKSKADDFIPRLSFKGRGAMNTCGLYETDNNNLRFAYDASRIPQSKGVLIEVSRPYCEFNFMSGTFRDLQPSKYALHSMRLNTLAGEFAVPPDVVKKPAYYQVRVAAIDENGIVVGSFSDPVGVATIKDLP